MKKIVIIIVIISAIVLSSCGISKGLHHENTFRNFTVRQQINKEHRQTFIE